MPGSTNRTPATRPPRSAVEQPADVDGQLLGLRAGQQHAVVQRVQEPALPDPAVLVDEVALHDGDLAGRAAEGLQRDREPRLDGLPERHHVAGRAGPAGRGVVAAVVRGVSLGHDGLLRVLRRVDGRAAVARRWYSYRPSNSGPVSVQDLVVVECHRQPAQHDVEAAGFRGVEPLVLEVGLVHDLGQLPQHRVGQVVAAQDRLERAVAALVAQLDAAHVERRRLGRHRGRVVDEHELARRGR